MFLYFLSPSRFKQICIFLYIFILFLSPARYLGSGDGLPTRLLPLSIIREQNFDLDEFVADNPNLANVYSIIATDGHYISKYPVISAILAVPIYIIPFFLRIPFFYPLVLTLAHISAAVIMALAAVFLYIILKKFISESWSIILTISYALGTSNWTISSQDLWQHGACQLFLILFLLMLFRIDKTQWHPVLAGFFAGLAIASRPISIIILFFAFIFILHRQRQYFLNAIFGLLFPLILLAIYNSYYFGAPWATGYGQEVYDSWTNSFFSGLSGLLISPSRGLFVFSPFLLFSLAGVLMTWRRVLVFSQNQQVLLRYLSGGMLTYILAMSNWYVWYGGYGYGSRMLLDILPLFVIFLMPVIKSQMFKKKPVKAMFLFLVLFSIFIQLTGVLFWDMSWYEKYSRPHNVDQSWLWNIRQSEPLYFINWFQFFDKNDWH